MCRSGSHPQANFCQCLATRSLVKERNSRSPVYLKSDRTGLIRVSQRDLGNAYPALLGDLRKSGNRTINPIDRFTPFFTSHHNYELSSMVVEFIISTVRNPPSTFPICPNFGYDPILEEYLMYLKEAVLLGDPMIFQALFERWISFLDAFSALAGSLGRNDILNQRLYPHFWPKSGLGPGIELLIRDIALSFLPSISEAGPEGVFLHIRAVHRATGNDASFVRKMLEALRLDEQRELLDLVLYHPELEGDYLSEKILNIFDGKPADKDELRQFLGHVGY